MLFRILTFFFGIDESLVEILNPIYIVLQESLERKINLLESDLSSFVEHEVIVLFIP